MMRPQFFSMDNLHLTWYTVHDECGGVQNRKKLHPRTMFNAPLCTPLRCILSKLNIIPKQKTERLLPLCFLFGKGNGLELI